MNDLGAYSTGRPSATLESSWHGFPDRKIPRFLLTYIHTPVICISSEGHKCVECSKEEEQKRNADGMFKARPSCNADFHAVALRNWFCLPFAGKNWRCVRCGRRFNFNPFTPTTPATTGKPLLCTWNCALGADWPKADDTIHLICVTCNMQIWLN